MRRRVVFNPLSYGGPIFGQWDNVILDEEAAHEAAKAARDALAEKLRAAGMDVTTYQVPNQRQTRSISGFHPEFVVTLFVAEYDGVV